MTKVYALYHSSRSMPIGVFDTEKLAFEALNFYAVSLVRGTNTVTAEKKEFDVVQFNVLNKMEW